MWGLQASIVDVETAFLQRDLIGVIYMNIPEGLKEDQDHCLLMKRNIHRWVNLFSINKALKNGHKLRNIFCLFVCQRDLFL
jgi:hypothetical protein